MALGRNAQRTESQKGMNPNEKIERWATNAHPAIECVGIKKHFPIGGRNDRAHTLRAVDGVSFSVRKGEIFGIVGESGSGKSTIGRCIVRLQETTEGRIFLDGVPVNAPGCRAVAPADRRRIQMVFQNPYASFNPRKSIGGAFVELGKVNGMSREAALARTDELLETVGLPPGETMRRRYPADLSGGQLQRLAIARALLSEPSVLIADEPVSALDVSVQAQILKLFVELRERLGLTVIFISHDLIVVGNLCDTVAVVYLGLIVEMAPVEKLFAKILHPYSKALFSAGPKEHPRDVSGWPFVRGDVASAFDIGSGCGFAGRCRHCIKSVCDAKAPPLTEVEPGHFAACHFPLGVGDEQFEI
jgi:peptide/nickel transport system ATP-binding protein/oligopeptide transport system ATP-binding protein